MFSAAMGCPWTGQYSGGVWRCCAHSTSIPGFHVSSLPIGSPIRWYTLIPDCVSNRLGDLVQFVGFLKGILRHLWCAGFDLRNASLGLSTNSNSLSHLHADV